MVPLNRHNKKLVRVNEMTARPEGEASTRRIVGLDVAPKDRQSSNSRNYCMSLGTQDYSDGGGLRLRSMASERIHSVQACKRVHSCQGQLWLQTDTEPLQPSQFLKRGRWQMALSRDYNLFPVQDSTSLY